MRDEAADFLLPKHFAVECQRRGVNRALIQKVNEELFAVARDCGGSR